MLKKTLILCACLAMAAFAKPVIKITLDKEDHLYKCGEQAVFTVEVSENDQKLTDKVETVFSLDGGKTIKKATMDLAEANPFTLQGTLDKPGFLRLTVTLRQKAEGTPKPTTTIGIGAAGYEPLKIQTGAPEPADFLAWWKGELAKADKTTPLDAKQEPVEFKNKGFKAYKVSFAAPGGRVYGFLTVPVKPGKYPVAVSVPGAGPGASMPNAVGGMVSLTMNVHPYDPIAPEGKTIKDLYNDLNTLDGKRVIYMYHGGPDKEKLFYHRAIIGIVRSLLWLEKQDYVQPDKMCYYGSSQGGGFGKILGGLYGKFQAIACNVPAMCDHYGALDGGRRPGWPQYMMQTAFSKAAEASKASVPYYDGANFARHITCPIRVIVGFIDNTCPPSCVYATYNALASKDKQIFNCVDMGHSGGPAYNEAVKWAREIVNPPKKPAPKK